jgi:uncharacterized membrane protein YpjA
MLGRFLNWLFEFILTNPLIFWACVLTNLGGALYGVFVWYRPMLESVPPWVWPFVPVCPLAALAGTLALLGERYGLGWRWLNALTAVACIKWGIWTLVFWTQHWSKSGIVQPIEIALFIAHIGLICEGILFALRIGDLAPAWRWAIVSWFAISFALHYGLGYHPPLSPFVSQSLVLWTSVVLLVPLCALLLWWPTRMVAATPAAVSSHVR